MIFSWSYQRWNVRQDLSHVSWVTHRVCVWNIFSWTKVVHLQCFGKMCVTEKISPKVKKKKPIALYKRTIYSSGFQSGVRVPPGVQTRTFRGTRKNWIMVGKGYLYAVTTYTLEITAAVLITNILLIRRVQFMEVGCQGVRKWIKGANH